VENEDERQLVTNLNPFCHQIETVLLSKMNSYRNMVKNLPGKIPFQVAYYQSSEFTDRLKELLKNNDYDLIHIHLIRMVPYTKDVNIPKILDLTDTISKYLETRYYNTKNPLVKQGIFWEWQRMLEYESTVHKYDAVSICSETDRDNLLALSPTANIKIFRNGLDLDYFHPYPDVKPESNSIIFTGNMPYPPNQDGILYFCEEILPLIRQDIPDVKLYIVGKSPTPAIQKLSSESIIVSGLVPDLRDYYARAQVAICPIRFGAGTLNKVIEPMAMGIPVVSTSIACTGMNVIDGKNILFGDTPDDFANSVVRLLKSPDMRRIISDAGKSLIKSEHDWEQIVSNLALLYQNIARSGVAI
jgi:hypothetical protein